MGMRWPAWLPWRLQPEERKSTPFDLNKEAKNQLCKALRADSVSSVQDLINCLLLSECVYKAHDLGPQEAVKSLKAFQESFPPGLTTLEAVQCSLPHVHHRYLVATSPNTVYVSFIGTKLAKDILVDANVFHRPLWQATEQDAGSPAAHRGFIARARRVPVEQLLDQARNTNRKLLLCGHSLGGAVATLCTLRVLQEASEAGLPPPPVRCITFGSPALGNSALAARVSQKGWRDCFQNVILPEDLVPRLLALAPEASSAELSGDSEVTAVEMRVPPPTRRWPTAGFSAFRRPLIEQVRVSRAEEQPSEDHVRVEPQLELEAAGQGGTGVSAVGGNGISQSQRVWNLPQRLWKRSEAAGPSQGPTILAPRAQEANQRDVKVQAVTAGSSPEAARSESRREGPLQAMSRRIPLQSWWGSGNHGEEEVATATDGEDGAVDALFGGPALPESPTPAAAKAAGSWAARLAQLQSMPATAASTVTSVGQILPTSVHFGRTIPWSLLEQPPQLPVSFPTSDIRSRLLANHRMPAYRVRALTHCAAIPGLPKPYQGSSSVKLSEEIIPPIILHKATASFLPFPPPEPSAAASSRWSWIPYVGGDGSAGASEVAMPLSVDGAALSTVRQGRLLAFGGVWCPVRVSPRPNPSLEQPKQRRGLDWLQQKTCQSPRDPESRLQAETRLPAAVTSQIYGQIASVAPPLELHLRSDFAQATVPVTVRLPTVWLLGSSTAAAKKLMTSLSQQATAADRRTAPLQPSELVLDGCKWCNLLATPVTNANLAMSALTQALPQQPGGRQWGASPLTLASSLVQGLQAWFAGPHVNLREGSSCSAIVVAIDSSRSISPRHFSKLSRQVGLAQRFPANRFIKTGNGAATISMQASRAGVDVLLVPVGGQEPSAIATRMCSSLNRKVISMEEDHGQLQQEGVLQLRKEVFRSLSSQRGMATDRSPLSKL